MQACTCLHDARQPAAKLPCPVTLRLDGDNGALNAEEVQPNRVHAPGGLENQRGIVPGEQLLVSKRIHTGPPEGLRKQATQRIGCMDRGMTLHEEKGEDAASALPPVFTP